MPYIEEAAAVAESSVLVSLFGSALHNCRLLRRGGLVVELHGSLRNDMGANQFVLVRRIRSAAGCNRCNHCNRCSRCNRCNRCNRRIRSTAGAGWKPRFTSMG